MFLKEHNRKAVDNLKKAISEGSRTVLYVSGTGCGKTWVFMGLASELHEIIPEFSQENRPKILYIMPKHVIKKNVEGYEDYKALGLNVDFETFNYFNNEEKAVERISQYDLVVIDECHHLGGDIYGKTILHAMQNTDKYFIGLTATPYRNQDRTDVSDYFDTKVKGISVWDAIQMGLMPAFNYNICLPEKDLKQVRKEYDNQVNAVLELTDSKESVQEIVEKYDRNKWICFFPNSKTLNESRQMVEEIFEGYQVFTLLASLQNLDEVIEGVKNAEKAVIMSVNILLEGVHLDDITGIVLYRNVTSSIAFQQILGRTCSIDNTIEPVIVDTSQAARKILAQLLSDNEKATRNRRVQKDGEKKDILKVSINGTQKYDLTSLLKEMDRKLFNEIQIKEAATKAIEKYHSFGGKDYDDYSSLESSRLDFQKFRACATLFKITAMQMFNNTMACAEEA